MKVFLATTILVVLFTEHRILTFQQTISMYTSYSTIHINSYRLMGVCHRKHHHWLERVNTNFSFHSSPALRLTWRSQNYV